MKTQLNNSQLDKLKEHSKNGLKHSSFFQSQELTGRLIPSFQLPLVTLNINKTILSSL